ncbi:hypothetical protein C8Q80DRAFT_1197930 [Daedaleopsis nitida]|nr:hypothetical protein C8Q80DRAFT_1197930 [Daedaleopsis nitida]
MTLHILTGGGACGMPGTRLQHGSLTRLQLARQRFAVLIIRCMTVQTNLLKAGRGVLGVFPIPGLSPATDVLLILIDKVGDTRTNRKALRALSHELSHLVKTIDDAERKFQSRIDQCDLDDPQRQTLVDGLQRSHNVSARTMIFRDKLKELKELADGLYDGPFLLRCFHSQRDAEILKDLHIGVTKAIQYFNMECQVAIAASVDEILRSLTAIHSTVKEVRVMVSDLRDTQVAEVQDKTLEALPHADAGYRAAINSTKSEFVEGTRMELFERIDSWVEGRTPGKAVCLLSGGAGTGKSTIASEFARRLHDAHDLGASFFFVRGVEDLASTRLFFPTMAYQLAQCQDEVRPHIIAAAREHLKHGRHQQMKYEAENLVRRPLRAVGKQHQAVFIVVDALDECVEDTSEHVLKMLELLMACVRDAPFPLRVFFTSRPEHLVENTLSSSRSPAGVHTISLHDLSPESVKRDISLLLREHISRMAGSSSLLQERPEVVDRLVQRADGLFIYARTAINFLATYPDDLEERVDMLLSEDSEERAIALGPLHDLYLTVLESAFPPKVLERQDKLRARVETTLGCIALLRDYVSPRVLEALTHIPTKETKSVLYHLRAVVLFNPDNLDEVFRPMHGTFVQFLIDSSRCTNRLYFVDARRHHARLAEGCLRTLLYLMKNICNLDNPAVLKAEIPDLRERVRVHVPQHVQYACVHWAAHLSKGEKSGQLGALLAEFASTKMLVWMETLGYMGRLDMADGALSSARDWLERPGRTYELLNQGRQLLIDHFAEIDACPDDVYGSSIYQNGHIPDSFVDGVAVVDANEKHMAIGVS